MDSKRLFYSLQVAIIIGATIINTSVAVFNGVTGLDLLFTSLISAISILGLLSIFSVVAVTWRPLGGALFIVMGIGALFFVSSFYNGRGLSYVDYPMLLLPHVILVVSFITIGILVWLNKVSWERVRQLSSGVTRNE